MKSPFRPRFSHAHLIATVVASILTLLTAEASSASYRRFLTFDGESVFLGNICTDGVSLGFSNTIDGPDRKVLVFRHGTEELLYESELATSWFYFNNPSPPGAQPGPYCEALQILGNSPGSVRPVDACSGPHYAQPPALLPVGTSVDIVFLQKFNLPWQNMEDSCNVLGAPNNCEGVEAIVEDCRLKDNQITLEQIVPASKSTVVTSSLVFEVAAIDTNLPGNPPLMAPILVNGRGIDRVSLSVVALSGLTVYSRIDASAPFCLFGETDAGTCQEWDFSKHSGAWPNGQPAMRGQHRLRALVDGHYSNDQVLEWEIDIRRPNDRNVHFLPYIAR
jgi:hypothetical protein